MQLRDHLKQTGERLSDFARRAGEAENTIRKIVYGQRQPSLPLAVKIAALTGGVVSEADLVITPMSDPMTHCSRCNEHVSAAEAVTCDSQWCPLRAAIVAEAA